MKIAVAGTGYVGLSLAVLLSQHNEVTAVDIIPEKVDCDLYRFLDGDADTINQYRGVYMDSYSWASMTEGMLDRKLN